MEINSFDMVMAIISGFQNAAAHRLKFSFEAVGKKTTETLDQINTLFSSQNSYKAYREMLNKVTPPAIPFLFVFLLSFMVTVTNALALIYPLSAIGVFI